jgi:hypothetical protein
MGLANCVENSERQKTCIVVNRSKYVVVSVQTRVSLTLSGKHTPRFRYETAVSGTNYAKMDTQQRVDGMENQDKLTSLKEWAAKLNETIVDKDAKDHFLKVQKNWLDDVERKVVPGVEHILPIIEQLLERAQEAVYKYGPNLRIIG